MTKPYITSAAILFVLFCSPAVSAQPHPSPKGTTPKGVSADKWLEDLRAANKGKWNEVFLLSPPLRYITARAKDVLHDHLEKGSACQRAAANLADAALFQEDVNHS